MDEADNVVKEHTRLLERISQQREELRGERDRVVIEQKQLADYLKRANEEADQQKEAEVKEEIQEKVQEKERLDSKIEASEQVQEEKNEGIDHQEEPHKK